MLARLFLLFTITTALELAILLKISQLMGWMATIALILGTGALGAWLTRREGIRALRALQLKVSAGELPADALLDGVMILIAGAFLITPGLLTDTTGFLLLIPPVRAVVRRAVARRVARFIETGVRGGTLRIVSTGLAPPPPGAGARVDPPFGSSRSFGARPDLADVIDVTPD